MNAKKRKDKNMGCSRWTPERRAKHSAAIRAWAPWTKSTGPRTPEGKETSKMNAWKHGAYCRQAYAFRAALRQNALTLKFLFQRQKEMLRFQRNELLRNHPPKKPVSPKIGVMRGIKNGILPRMKGIGRQNKENSSGNTVCYPNQRRSFSLNGTGGRSSSSTRRRA